MRRDIILGAIGVGIVSLFLALRRKPVAAPPVQISIDPLPKFYAPEPVAAPSVVEWRPAVVDMRAPHEKRGFGSDSARNVDTITPDDYMNLPLIGTGKTYKNETMYMDTEEDSSRIATDVKRFKYIRLVVLGVRKGHTVTLGGVRFMQGRSMNSHTNVSTWNPHTGEKDVYMETEWSDNDQRTIVFCFKDPADVSRYELKTSTNSHDHDPIRWKLEGSTNGTYWIVLDDRSQTNVSFPVQRDIWIMYQMNAL
jgi:hypothetical protein